MANKKSVTHKKKTVRHARENSHTDAPMPTMGNPSLPSSCTAGAASTAGPASLGTEGTEKN